MKLKNIILVVVASVIFSALAVIVGASGVLLKLWGVIYTVLILAALVALFMIAKKLYLERKLEEEIKEMVKDPRRIYEKLKEHGTIIDNGKEVKITLETDKETGKDTLNIQVAGKVNQAWRKKFEVDKEGTETTEAKPKPQAKPQAKPKPKPRPAPSKPKGKGKTKRS